jgi:hypothetical protein
VHRFAAALALTLLIAITMPFGGADAAEKVRTDPGPLPGYIIEGRAAPLSMLMYEPVIPVPVEPGEPHGEGSLSYTLTTLNTGPQGRALASSVWPGAALGDGFSTLCECDENYRAKSEANYPGREEQQTNTQGSKETGSGMFTEALGLDVLARASSAESPNAEAMGLGNAWSRNESTVRNGRAISSVVSAVEDVALGGGVITIDSVRTDLKAVSNGKKASTTGVTEVNGLTIGGQGYQVDEKGIRPVQDDKPQDSPVQLPEMPGAKELHDQLGIKVIMTEHTKSRAGAAASRQAGGLRISMETAVLKNALMENLPIQDILDSVPNEIKGQFAQLLALAPRVDFVFARGQVEVAGSRALKFDLPDPPKPPPPADDPPAPPADTPPASTPVDTTPEQAPAPPMGGTDTGPAPADSGGLTPVAAPAAPAAPVTPASAQIPLGGGVPAALVGAGLVLSALGGRALAGLSGMAMGGASGAFCSRGSPRRVPNLRS